jgi:cation diffusion facilitator CzcD-associated flavoprotein CzcO
MKYAIIGAGPSGLAAARNLQKLGIPFVGFEKYSDVGGLWNIQNPHSTVYESAHLISSKTMTEFHEFPMKEGTPDYPAHHHLNQYFKDFSEHFKLKEHYLFNSEIKKVERTADGMWDIHYNQAGKDQVMKVKGVILATGTLHYPNEPKYEGKFTGEIIHSSKYKSPKSFEGKRVLIIGAGNSGCDIAVDAIHWAKFVDMSLRRGYHFVPKYIFGKPADTMGKMKIPGFIKKAVQKKILQFVVGDPSRVGFPKADHALFESHPIVNSLVLYHAGHGDLRIQKDIDRMDGKRVYFKGGASEEYDLIVNATGYKLKYPFMNDQDLNWKGARPDFYLNIFHPEYDNLFILGMVEALGIGWQGRYDQGEIIARFIKAVEAKSEGAKKFGKLKRENNIDLTGGMNYIKLDRMAYYVHKDTYISAIHKGIRSLQV